MLLLHLTRFIGALASMQGSVPLGPNPAFGDPGDSRSSGRRPQSRQYLRRMDRFAHDAPQSGEHGTLGLLELQLDASSAEDESRRLAAQSADNDGAAQTPTPAPTTSPTTAPTVATPVPTDVNRDYISVNAQGENTGAQLTGSGNSAWTTLEACVTVAMNNNYVAGDTVKFISSGTNNKCYYYGPGDTGAAMTSAESYRLEMPAAYAIMGRGVQCGNEQYKADVTADECKNWCSANTGCKAYVTFQNSDCDGCVAYTASDCSTTNHVATTCTGSVIAYNKVEQKAAYTIMTDNSDPAKKIFCGTGDYTQNDISSEECKNWCTGNPGCKAYVTFMNSDCDSCLAYTGNDCSPAHQQTSVCSGQVTAYNKVEASYTIVGRSVECGTEQFTDDTMSPEECKVWCTTNEQCKAYVTFENSDCDRCIAYTANDCSAPYHKTTTCTGTITAYNKATKDYSNWAAGHQGTHYAGIDKIYGKTWEQETDYYSIAWPIVTLSGTNADGTYAISGGDKANFACESICQSISNTGRRSGYDAGSATGYPTGAEARATFCTFKGSIGNSKDDWDGAYQPVATCQNAMERCECQGNLPSDWLDAHKGNGYAGIVKIYGKEWTQYDGYYQFTWPIITLSGSNTDGTYTIKGGTAANSICEAMCQSLTRTGRTTAYQPGSSAGYPAGAELKAGFCTSKGAAITDNSQDWTGGTSEANKVDVCTDSMERCDCQGKLPTTAEVPLDGHWTLSDGDEFSISGANLAVTKGSNVGSVYTMSDITTDSFTITSNFGGGSATFTNILITFSDGKTATRKVALDGQWYVDNGDEFTITALKLSVTKGPNNGAEYDLSSVTASSFSVSGAYLGGSATFTDAAINFENGAVATKEAATHAPTPPPTFAPTEETGDKECQAGLRDGSICCQAQCGTCGGVGCEDRPGGNTNCCRNTIDQSQRSCNEFAAPCIVQGVIPDPTPDPTAATEMPTPAPTGTPTTTPTDGPTPVPTSAPTVSPTGAATFGPSEAPTEAGGTLAPSEVPTEAGTVAQDGTVAPTDTPTTGASGAPTDAPTANPTTEPSEAATETPTDEPTVKPTEEPTEDPTNKPTEEPTEEPTATDGPTQEPTEEPTAKPTEAPTAKPTAAPTEQPTPLPTGLPSEQPTDQPTAQPTGKPTETPTTVPTESPTAGPTGMPTGTPTEVPSAKPTEEPTELPSTGPTVEPTEDPTGDPTEDPTEGPSVEDTEEPTEEPTDTPDPTEEPTEDPTESDAPTKEPTEEPTDKPTQEPTEDPTEASSAPSSEPTGVPTTQPTPSPTTNPTTEPTTQPTDSPPTSAPSTGPSEGPTTTAEPTEDPTMSPSKEPTEAISGAPSTEPTLSPSLAPTNATTMAPTGEPTPVPPTPLPPTEEPSQEPTKEPTVEPTPEPTAEPTPPTPAPTEVPTQIPSPEPTPIPTAPGADKEFWGKWVFVFDSPVQDEAFEYYGYNSERHFLKKGTTCGSGNRNVELTNQYGDIIIGLGCDSSNIEIISKAFTAMDPCRNQNPSCENWAMVDAGSGLSECERNPSFMRKTCPEACQLCPDQVATRAPTPQSDFVPAPAQTFGPTTLTPTSAPSPRPTPAPTSNPTPSPSNPTKDPTPLPPDDTFQPSEPPTPVPTRQPTSEPTYEPTSPTFTPTATPTQAPEVKQTVTIDNVDCTALTDANTLWKFKDNLKHAYAQATGLDKDEIEIVVPACGRASLIQGSSKGPIDIEVTIKSSSESEASTVAQTLEANTNTLQTTMASEISSIPGVTTGTVSAVPAKPAVKVYTTSTSTTETTTSETDTTTSTIVTVTDTTTTNTLTTISSTTASTTTNTGSTTTKSTLTGTTTTVSTATDTTVTDTTATDTTVTATTVTETVSSSTATTTTVSSSTLSTSSVSTSSVTVTSTTHTGSTTTATVTQTNTTTITATATTSSMTRTETTSTTTSTKTDTNTSATTSTTETRSSTTHTGSTTTATATITRSTATLTNTTVTSTATRTSSTFTRTETNTTNTPTVTSTTHTGSTTTFTTTATNTTTLTSTTVTLTSSTTNTPTTTTTSHTGSTTTRSTITITRTVTNTTGTETFTSTSVSMTSITATFSNTTVTTTMMEQVNCQSQTGFQLTQNSGIDGLDPVDVTSFSEGSCCELCDANQECTAYTFKVFPEDGRVECRLKTGDPIWVPVTDGSEIFSGVPYSRENNNDLSTTTSTTVGCWMADATLTACNPITMDAAAAAVTHSCKSWCATKQGTWPMKCRWSSCRACKACPHVPDDDKSSWAKHAQKTCDAMGAQCGGFLFSLPVAYSDIKHKPIFCEPGSFNAGASQGEVVAYYRTDCTCASEVSTFSGCRNFGQMSQSETLTVTGGEAACYTECRSRSWCSNFLPKSGNGSSEIECALAGPEPCTKDEAQADFKLMSLDRSCLQSRGPDALGWYRLLKGSDGQRSDCPSVGCRDFSSSSSKAGLQLCQAACMGLSTCNVIDFCDTGGSCTSQAGRGRCCMHKCTAGQQTQSGLEARNVDINSFRGNGGWDVYFYDKRKALSTTTSTLTTVTNTSVTTSLTTYTNTTTVTSTSSLTKTVSTTTWTSTVSSTSKTTTTTTSISSTTHTGSTTTKTSTITSTLTSTTETPTSTTHTGSTTTQTSVTETTSTVTKTGTTVTGTTVTGTTVTVTGTGTATDTSTTVTSVTETGTTLTSTTATKSITATDTNTVSSTTHTGSTTTASSTTVSATTLTTTVTPTNTDTSTTHTGSSTTRTTSDTTTPTTNTETSTLTRTKTQTDTSITATNTETASTTSVTGTETTLTDTFTSTTHTGSSTTWSSTSWTSVTVTKSSTTYTSTTHTGTSTSITKTNTTNTITPTTLTSTETQTTSTHTGSSTTKTKTPTTATSTSTATRSATTVTVTTNTETVPPPTKTKTDTATSTTHTGSTTTLSSTVSSTTSVTSTTHTGSTTTKTSYTQSSVTSTSTTESTSTHTGSSTTASSATVSSTSISSTTTGTASSTTHTGSSTTRTTVTTKTNTTTLTTTTVVTTKTATATTGTETRTFTRTTRTSTFFNATAASEPTVNESATTNESNVSNGSNGSWVWVPGPGGSEIPSYPPPGQPPVVLGSNGVGESQAPATSSAATSPTTAKPIVWNNPNYTPSTTKKLAASTPATTAQPETVEPVSKGGGVPPAKSNSESVGPGIDITPEVSVDFTLMNLQYSLLTQTQADEIMNRVSGEIALLCGVPEYNIAVSLSPGSIWVQADIFIPEGGGSTVTSVTQAFETNNQQFAEMVVRSVAQVEGIQDAKTGLIGCTDILVTSGEKPFAPALAKGLSAEVHGRNMSQIMELFKSRAAPPRCVADVVGALTALWFVIAVVW